MNRRYSLIAFIVILSMLVSPSGVQAQKAGPASPEAILAALRKGMAREIIQIIEERFQ